MNINELTQILNLLNNTKTESKLVSNKSSFLGKKVIIRTYSAGVWFGTLIEKDGKEVILKDAKRMYQWWCKKSISLNGVAKYGIIQKKSKICPAIDKVWLEAIEILELTDDCINSIESCPEVEQE